MEHALTHSLFFNDHRLRAGWRIAIFAVLFVAFSTVGQLALALFPPEIGQAASVGMSLLAALVAGWIVLARLDGRPIGALGFAIGPTTVREIVGGLLVGGALIAAVTGLLLLTGTAVFVPDDGTLSGYAATLLQTLLFFSVAAAWEEVLFRGYPFQALVEGIGPIAATLIASAAFSALHARNPNIDSVAFFNIFLAGVLLSAAYLRTRSLWFATAVHTGWNWTMATLFDFPVSGLLFDTPLYSGVSRGAEWWTGGVFGPEAGLAGTFALLAGTLWILRTRRLGESPTMRALGPIVDRRLGVEAP